MNEFSDSILTGIQSAHDAAANNREIRSTIADMSAAVEQVTEGSVSLVHERLPTMGVNFLSEVLAPFTQLQHDDVLSFRRSKAPHQAEELGRLEIPTAGYPCIVKFAGKKMSCHDKISLVSILKDMLSSPEAGKALLKLRAVADAG